MKLENFQLTRKESMMFERDYWSLKGQVLSNSSETFQPHLVIPNFNSHFLTPWSFQLLDTPSGIHSDSLLWKDISLTVMESSWQNICHWMRSMMKINFFDVKSISFEYSTSLRIKYSIYGINEFSVQPKYRKFLISKV